MSRTRIVKGIYNKITKGSHNMFAEENIVSSASREVKQKGGDGISFNAPGRLENTISDDFKITFSIKKDNSYKTIVPLGILDYEGKYENPFFAFNFSLSQSNVDSLKFEVFDEEGKSIYSITNLPEVVVGAVKHQTLLESIQKKKPQFDPLKPVNIWEWKPVFIPFNVPPSDYTKIGSYIILWDGFDNDDIYDSVRFNNKKLKAKITAIKSGKQKSLEVEFSTAYDKVKWVDVKIDKKNKKINTTLRVDLRDGGANGLKCSTYITGGKLNPHWETKCPWNDIPKDKIKASQPIIKSQTKSFKELEQLALEGLNYHWGRNKKHASGIDIKVFSDSYEFLVNTVNTKQKSMDDVDLVYNTNYFWGRSNNPGCVSGFKSFMSNLLQYIPYVPLNETIFYNVGYVNNVYKAENHFLFKESWMYIDDRHLYKNGKSMVDMDFSYTCAHEIGHTILRAYAEGGGGSADYSYKHKGSSGYSDTLPKEEGGEDYPTGGEIDLMKYFNKDPRWYDFERIVAEDRDVLGLIWLTKLELK